jgi:nucleoside-diphosphate-sugar epimerase
LLHDGLEVISVDSKQLENWYQVHSESQNLVIDLKDYQACLGVTRRVDTVYNCAANMGGIKFIEENKTNCMLNSLSNTHLLMAARENDVKRYFFASSACVYPQSLQSSPNVKALKEEDAYPAMPEDGYGWEKLFSERMCKHFFEDFGLQTKIARFHNIYGPHGTWFGGREKAPAAICRKIAIAKLSNQKSIEIWGDGKQTRSFTFIEDCVKGIKDIVGSSLIDPVNLGSSFLVSINELDEIQFEWPSRCHGSK